jgi:hypothetical protein
MEDNKFKYQYSYALYLISEGTKNGKINEIEKMILKKLILYQYIKIDRIIKRFEKSGNSENLWEEIKRLADSTDLDSDDEFSDKSTSLSNNEDLISSPKDTALYQKKRKYRAHKEEDSKEANYTSSDISSPVIKMKSM